MHLVYITFGDNTQNHLQAAFSIYSFLAWPGVSTVNVITDEPSFYKHLGDRVNLIVLTKDLLQEWRGPEDYLWRIKIKGIEYVAHLYPGEPVIYLDTDTFLYSDPTHLYNGLRTGKAFMHMVEWPLSEADTKTGRVMWRELKGTEVVGIPMRPTDIMWNAGLVAIPNTEKGADVALALRVCDALHSRLSRKGLAEQYGNSLAFSQHYEVLPGEAFIGHYWSNKDEWRRAIGEFFNAAYFHGYTQEQIMQAIRRFPFGNQPVMTKERSTHARLVKRVGKWFPPRSVRYVK